MEVDKWKIYNYLKTEDCFYHLISLLYSLDHHLISCTNKETNCIYSFFKNIQRHL